MKPLTNQQNVFLLMFSKKIKTKKLISAVDFEEFRYYVFCLQNYYNEGLL